MIEKLQIYFKRNRKMKAKRLWLLFLFIGFCVTAQIKDIDQNSKLVPIQIKEVQIENPRASLTNELAKFDKNKVHFYYGLGTDQYSLAKFFVFNDTIKQTPFLKSITIDTKGYKRTSSVKIRIMTADEDGNPATDLINEDLILKVKKGHRKSELDVSKYKLKIDEEGIFVVIELLKIKDNEYYYYDRNKKKYVNYSPAIGALPSEQKTLWIYNKEWKRRVNRDPYDYEDQREYYNKFIELAISLKLTN